MDSNAAVAERLRKHRPAASGEVSKQNGCGFGGNRYENAK
jgi:hypothetical protein